jgi:putative membrane protein
MMRYKAILVGALMLTGVMAASYATARAASDTKSSDKLSRSDTSFIKEAAQGGMMEVELGKLAQEKASSEKVKQFGKRMEDDHSKANSDLKELASTKGVELPTALSGKQKSTVERLSKLSGTQFDQQYMTAMVSDHKEDVSKFQSESSKANDPDVKQFASKTLPTLKEHLQLAESTAKDVKTTSRTQSNGK